MKPKRKIDQDLFEFVKTIPCICCKPGDQNTPTDPHHVTTRKAGGADEAKNLMPLCRTHHIQVHKEGWRKFCDKNPTAKRWLIQANRQDIILKMKRGAP